MKFTLRTLVILPVFLVLAGFGPWNLIQSKQEFKSLTHIPYDEKEYLSKEEIEKKLTEYNQKHFGYTSPSRQRTRRQATPGTYIVSATAYSSTVDQCDATPFITASGQHVRDGIIATNFLPFGTKVKIPDVYGDKVFEVQDRMNARYQTRVDVWMETRHEAIQFGLRQIEIEVLDL